MKESKANSDSGREFYDAALRICAGEFQLPAVEVELAARERKALRCEAKIEQLQAEQNQCSMGGRDAEYSRLKAKLEEIRRKKAEAEVQFAVLKKQATQIRDDVKASRAQICSVIRKKKASDKNYGAIKRVKRELLALASEVNPHAAKAAEKLGVLFARTPAFIIQLGITDDGRSKNQFAFSSDNACAYDEDDGLMQLPSESMLNESFAGETWDIFERVDTFAQQAEAQCAMSIVMLMGMLTAEERCPQVTQHLIRTIVDKAELVQRKDAMAMRDSETCVVTVNWPSDECTTGECRRTTSFMQYKDLLAWADRECEETMLLHDQFMPTGKDSEGSLPVSKAEVLKQSKQKITREFFAEVAKEDGLLHFTPLVCELLIKVAQRGYEAIMLEHTVLYAHRGDRTKEEHWFFRRKAAGKVCEIALQGSEMAQRMMVKELLTDEHWMVRALVVSEASHLLGLMDPTKEFFDEAVKSVVSVVYLAPKLSNRGHPETPDQVEMRVTTQRAAETSLVKEMQRYKPDIYKKVLHELHIESDAQPEQNKPVLKRFMESIGHTKGARIAVQGSNKDLAREMRRSVQAEIIYNEDRQRQIGA